jgi:hypothetical protein
MHYARKACIIGYLVRWALALARKQAAVSGTQVWSVAPFANQMAKEWLLNAGSRW